MAISPELLSAEHGPPALQIKFLRDHHLLWPDHPAQLEAYWRPHSLRVGLIWKPDEATLVVVDQLARQVLTELKVQTGEAERRGSAYLLCPVSGERSTVVYLHEGRWGSSRALGLKYSSQYMTRAQRREMRTQFPEALQRHRPNHPQVLTPAQPRSAVKASVARGYSYGSADALIDPKAQPQNYKEAEGYFQRSRRDHHLAASRSGAAAPSPAAGLPIGIWETYPLLELSTLVRAGLVVDGEARTALFVFNHYLTRLRELAVSVDLIDPQTPFIALLSSRSPPARQVLKLTQPGARARRLIICPISGRRVETVAYREGLWASREALRLENASQRGAHFMMMANRRRFDVA